MIQIIKITLTVSILALCSCSNAQDNNKKYKKATEEELMSANKYLVLQDAQTIKDYILKYNLNYNETQTGLWYNIEDPGEGQKVKKGDIITLSYQVSLLDGTICYDSKTNGNKEFRVGQGGVESGLEEGVLLLKNKSKASFIMPPHLAHGLLGDDNKIPSRAIIIYKLEVVNVK